MTVSDVEMKASSARVAHSLMSLNPANQHGNALKSSSVTAKDASSTSTANSGSDITSNDFLTLLVTEMQNQDPTQPTDPNAYIQQLVGVNSLQQLISINQELGTAVGATSTTSSISSPSASAANVAATPAVDNF